MDAAFALMFAILVTALTTTIIYNNHSVLRLLLDRWFEYMECPRLKGPHLLDLVIDHADIETMSILTHATHLQIHGHNSYVLGKFGPQLRKRHDLTEDMVAAFELLLDAIREYPKRLKRGQSCMNQALMDFKKDPESLEDDSDSVDEYEDAPESLGLVSDDLSTLPRHRCPRPTSVPDGNLNG